MGIYNGSNIDLNIKYFKFLSSSILLLFTRSKYLSIVADKMILNKNYIWLKPEYLQKLITCPFCIYTPTI